MKLTRRVFALGGLFAVAGIFGFRHYTSPQRAYLRVLGEEFGTGIARQPDAMTFAEALGAHSRQNGGVAPPREDIIRAFLRTTNVVRALETNEALVFVGDQGGPIDAPCQNTLSAGWL